MTPFDRLESSVQSYARSFPAVFDRAQGATLFDRDGKPYLDFLSGAGSLNYGHNHPILKEALISYIMRDGVAHSLDLHTEAKGAFLEAFERRVLQPRTMDYVLQFTGPTGTNAVEAALKLARRITGRATVVSFTNGFHGVSAGALAATGNRHHRDAAGVMLAGVTRMPYDGYLGTGVDTTVYLDKVLSDASSGVDLPAAALVECVQGEGGLTAAGASWLRNLERVCRRHGIMLIVDDIQAGCGRTGTFFSFETAGITPDMITLSKSLSGLGLPMAVLLIRRALDQWKPGEHNGTFRGNNHAFVTARAALDTFWADDALTRAVAGRAVLLRDRLTDMRDRFGPSTMSHRGRGMMQGLVMPSPDVAKRVSRHAFAAGLIVELAGPEDEVVKCLPPLTISEAELTTALDILEGAVSRAVTEDASAAA